MLEFISKNIDKCTMKRILIVIGLLIIIPMIAFAQIASIKWNTNLEYARKLAETKKQPMLLFFMDEPAGTLSNSVFNNTLSNNLIVDKVNKNFVPVLFKGDEVLQREYSVSRIPTLMVLDNLGVEMDRLSGVIGIDQAFAMLENAQRNFETRSTGLVPGGTISPSGITNYESGDVYTYETGKGSFIRKGGDRWVHKTSFYTVNYTQNKEDQRHYYLVSEDRKVNIALPKTTNYAVWVWREDENRWVPVEEIAIIEQDVSR